MKPVPCGRFATAFMLLFVLSAAAHAQYFGRNKVLWERFDFQIMETDHFRIYYYPPDAPHAEYVARLAERWYQRLSTFFQHEFEERKPLIVYRDHADFQQTVVSTGLISEATGGFTESLENRVVFPLTGIHADNDHVIGHELVHVFQFDLMLRSPARGGRRSQRLPLWAIEGLAEYLSQGRYDAATAMWMRDAVLHEWLPDPDKWFQRQPSPYHYGQAVWAYVAGRWDDDAVRRLFIAALSEGLDGALQQTFGTNEAQFFKDFNATLRSAYQPLLEERQAIEDTAQALLTEETTGAAVNLAPSVSPDGRWIAFLSTRELVLELYLANAATGEVERKLVSADADPHFDNLSFLDSSVAWAPDSRRFAFAVFARGERRLAIYNLERGRVEQRLDLPGVTGMRDPAWSPDGRSLVFSGVVAGASDLYLLDLETNRLTRLTDDPYTAIQPVFAPDGRQLAFVTDRGPRTDLDLLSFGELQLALLDLSSHEIEVLSIFERGKHIDPHFSADGQSLYFLAEPAGVPNVFRYDLATRRALQLTNLKGGVAGITSTSPALSIAAGDTPVFSALVDGGWSTYRLQQASGAPVITAQAPADVLPPIPAGQAHSVVEDYLSAPQSGLPPAERDYPTERYDPDIRLTQVGPAAVQVSTSSLGTEVGGATSFYFNDPLNRHQIVTTVQSGSAGGVLNFGDTLSAEVSYLNQTHRVQWGGRALHLPYVSSATFTSRQAVEVDGTTVPADVVERFYEVVKVDELSVIGQYPLSANNRVESAVGFSHMDFSRKLERLVYPDGFAPFRQEFDLPAPGSLNLQDVSLAYVHDSSRFGYISPVRGTRWRAEARWTTGDLNYQTLLFDYRRYFFRPPLTLATRLVHLGRHGTDAEDERLSPLDIGRDSLVRGYELGSFDLSECTLAADQQSCPEFDRLIGSRIAVVNLELRLALFGAGDFGVFDFPAAPTEASLFVDAGAAWSSGESVKLRFERETAERVPVISTGLSLRSLFIGALPIELYYAFPLQRPEKDGVFGFWIGMGW